MLPGKLSCAELNDFSCRVCGDVKDPVLIEIAAYLIKCPHVLECAVFWLLENEKKFVGSGVESA